MSNETNQGLGRFAPIGLDVGCMIAVALMLALAWQGQPERRGLPDPIEAARTALARQVADPAATPALAGREAERPAPIPTRADARSGPERSRRM